MNLSEVHIDRHYTITTKEIVSNCMSRPIFLHFSVVQNLMVCTCMHERIPCNTPLEVEYLRMTWFAEIGHILLRNVYRRDLVWLVVKNTCK